MEADARKILTFPYKKIKERDDVVLTHVSKKKRDRLADSLFLEAQRDV
jgi:hypothetical protein